MELWYPGQMAKTKRMLKQWLPHMDIIIEVLDARIPRGSQNPELVELIGEKNRIVALNKADLADKRYNNIWRDYLHSKGEHVIISDAKSNKSISSLKNIIKRITYHRKKRYRKTLKLMVVGIPNVGKSTIINQLSGRKVARVGDRPGITRGYQWIRLDPGYDLLDMPGLLWPRASDRATTINLAAVGSVQEGTVDIKEVARIIIEIIKKEKPDSLYKNYGLTNIDVDFVTLLEKIGRTRGCLSFGGKIDYQKTAKIIVREFKDGKLGRFTLEVPKKGTS